jgi:hypothetical protein
MLSFSQVNVDAGWVERTKEKIDKYHVEQSLIE